MNCATIAKGMVAASKAFGIKKPVIVRLQGTNMTAAREILEQSALPFTMEGDLDNAAKKVVAALKA